MIICIFKLMIFKTSVMDVNAVEALKTCQDIQHMIDITSQHLDRLR